MICPYCDADNDRVIDSRASEGGIVVRRRRECLDCTRRFTTYERVEKTRRLMVVKKDGTRVPFDEDRILAGVQAACGKRPIAEQSKVDLVRTVEEHLYQEYDREVPSAVIGEHVSAGLRAIDPIAYLRFVSEYRDFRTLSELAEELADLQTSTPAVQDQQDLFKRG